MRSFITFSRGEFSSMQNVLNGIPTTFELDDKETAEHQNKLITLLLLVIFTRII